jgi:hypothetical protein
MALSINILALPEFCSFTRKENSMTKRNARVTKKEELQTVFAKPQEQLPPITVSLKELFSEQHRYNVYPEFQRDEVWNIRQRQSFIDSLLLGESIPPLEGYEFFEPNGEKCWKIIDGHQRLSAIFGFMNNEFKTWSAAQKRAAEPNSKLGPVEENKCFAEMSPIARNYLQDYRIRIDRVRDTSLEEVTTRFLRINQNHVPLTAAERLRVYPSKANNAARHFEKHSFWENLYEGKDRRRAERYQSSLYLLAIEMTEGGILDLQVKTGNFIHRLAVGEYDDMITDLFIDAVNARMDIVCHLFSGAHFTVRAVSIAMYQSVKILEESGYVIHKSDRGRLTPWISAIISESARASGLPNYSQPVQRLTSGKKQVQFWNRHRERVLALMPTPELLEVGRR